MIPMITGRVSERRVPSARSRNSAKSAERPTCKQSTLQRMEHGRLINNGEGSSALMPGARSERRRRGARVTFAFAAANRSPRVNRASARGNVMRDPPGKDLRSNSLASTSLTGLSRPVVTGPVFPPTARSRPRDGYIRCRLTSLSCRPSSRQIYGQFATMDFSERGAPRSEKLRQQ